MSITMFLVQSKYETRKTNKTTESIVSPVSLHNTGGFQPLNNSAVLLVFPNCKIMSTVSRIPD